VKQILETLDRLLNHPALVDALGAAADWLWGWPLQAVLLGAGVFVTLRLSLPQVRGFVHSIQLLGGRYRDENAPGAISHFQALSTALSGTIGTGNVVGVATALSLGGPGALFWMWVTAFFGMGIKSVECTLAVQYREVLPDGRVLGGPMHYFRRGLAEHMPRLAPKLDWMAPVFAALLIVVALNSGNMVQVKSIVGAVHSLVAVAQGAGAEEALQQDTSLLLGWVVGLVTAVLVAVVLLGGIRRIGKVTSTVVPAMTVLYVGAALVVILSDPARAWEAFQSIFVSAFDGHAAVGGFAGAGLQQAMRFGVARGLFSNEAGQGTSPIAHSAAATNHPIREGLVAMLEPFIDTIIICTMTGVVILMAGPEVWAAGAEAADRMTAAAFAQHLGTPGAVIVAVGLALFASSTVLGWYYYGEQGTAFLGGRRAVRWYIATYLVCVVLGGIVDLTSVWTAADICNGLLAVPNLIVVVLLAPVVKAQYERYMSDHG
jgi:AGCS family alanine or glycine:cation symporter